MLIRFLRSFAAVVAVVAVLAASVDSLAAQGGTPESGVVLLGNGVHYLDVGVGIMNIGEKGSMGAKVELRFGRKLGGIAPAVGGVADSDGEFYGYGGLYADLAYRHLILTPLLGLGVYLRGDGKNLGGRFECRPQFSQREHPRWGECRRQYATLVRQFGSHI